MRTDWKEVCVEITDVKKKEKCSACIGMRELLWSFQKEMIKKLVITLSILLNSGCSTLTDNKNFWPEVTKADLNFIYTVIKESHPGPVDSENKDFKTWLEKGRAEAESLAKETASYEGYEFAIKHYVENFNDGHLNFWVTYDREKDKWPGFLVAYRQGKYIVYETQKSKVKKGDVLQSCDEKSIEQLLKENIYKFKGMPEPKSKLYHFAPHLLVDKGNPFISLPKKCVFVNNKKQTYAVSIEYTKIVRKDIDEKIIQAQFGKKVKFGFQKIAKGTYWISIPTFGPNKRQQKYLHTYIKKIRSLRKKAKIIVFDVRGNPGGSSKWGGLLLSALHGENNVEFVDNKLYSEVRIDWRVSQRNLDAVRKWPRLLSKQFGEDSESATWAKKFLMRFEEAFQTRKVFLTQDDKKNASEQKQNRTLKLKNIFQGQVYFLTDGRCGSACLDFADRALAFPSTTHIGLETGADTVYMEGNLLKTPSKLGGVFYPMKVWRNRVRGNRESYKPKHVWKGEIANTKALEKWILSGLNEKFNK